MDQSALAYPDDERRRVPRKPPETASLSWVEEMAIRHLLRHDKFFHGRSTRWWQTDYSLCDHSLQLAEKMEELGRAAGHDGHRVVVRRISGLFHDYGKVNPKCFKYRLRRVLKPREKEEVNRHPIYSEEVMCLCTKWVRPEDALILIDARPIVRWHHCPAAIKNRWQRKIAFELSLMDTLLAMIEDRWWKGIGILEALDILPDIARENRNGQFPMDLFGDEIEEALSLVNSVYDFEMRIPEIIRPKSLD